MEENIFNFKIKSGENYELKISKEFKKNRRRIRIQTQYSIIERH